MGALQHGHWRGSKCDGHRHAATVGAVEAEEAGGEVAAAEEVADGGEDVGAERTEGGAVFFLVGGEERVPSGGEDLPEGRGAGAAGW